MPASQTLDGKGFGYVATAPATVEGDWKENEQGFRSLTIYTWARASEIGFCLLPLSLNGLASVCVQYTQYGL